MELVEHGPVDVVGLEVVAHFADLGERVPAAWRALWDRDDIGDVRTFTEVSSFLGDGR